jgi:peptidoglycan/LPS O-acetylase OafA/YrhL
LALVAALALVGELAVRNSLFQETVGYSIQSLALIPIFYYVLSTRSLLTRCLEWNLLRQIGQLSYTLYLVHDVIRYALDSMIQKTLPVMVLSGTLSVGVALLMRYAVENPLRRLIR